MPGRGSIGFVLVMAMLAGSGCSRGNESAAGENHTRPSPGALSGRNDAGGSKGPATVPTDLNGTMRSTPASRHDVVEQLLEKQGRQSLSADFEGAGATSIVFYGSFARDIPASTPDYVIGDALLMGTKIKPIAKGDYGIVLFPSGDAGKPILLKTYESPVFKLVTQADELSYCWEPRGKEGAVAIGSEDGVG